MALHFHDPGSCMSYHGFSPFVSQNIHATVYSKYLGRRIVDGGCFSVFNNDSKAGNVLRSVRQLE